MPSTKRNGPRDLMLLLALVGPGLSGCIGVNQALADQPEEIFHSPEPVAQVADCLSKSNALRLMERPDGSRVAIFRNGWGGVNRTLSLYPEGTGTRVEKRSFQVPVPGARWRRCIGLEPAR